MSLTLDGNVERVVLNDAKQRKVLTPIKGGRKQLTMICGNWQGVLLERVYTAHSVTLCAFNSKRSKKHNYVYYISPRKFSAIDRDCMASVSHKI